MKHLMQLPMDDPTSAAAVLMDRLYHREPGLLTGPPPTPFEHVEVNASPQPAYEPPPQQQQQQQQYDMCRQPPSRESRWQPPETSLPHLPPPRPRVWHRPARLAAA